MNKALLLLTAIVVALLSSVSADEYEAVIALGDDDFEDFIQDNEFVLAEFYAPWCSHCKRLEPEYKSAAETLKKEKSDVKLVKVDATVHSSTAQTYGVQGYPTLKFFRDGKAIDYEGGRTAHEIVAWVKKKSGPPSVHLETKEAIESFKGGEGTKIIAFVDVTKNQKTWQKFAKSPKVDDFLLAHVTDASLFGDSKSASAVLYKPEEPPLAHDGKFSKSALLKWVMAEGFPLVDQLAQPVWARAEKAKKPLLAIFEEEGSEVEGVKALAKEFKGKVVFSVTNQVQLAERWGASGNVVPTAILVQWKGGEPKMTIWDEDAEEDLESETLKEFIEGSIDGTYKSYVKSEPIPESNDGPVTVIVGKNFDKIVRSEKDVLLEFYAPWCGHCKKLAPVWDELGEAFKDDDSIVIAKIDATANGLPDDVTVTGFPTIILFDKNNQQVKYDGGRDLESFKDWLAKRSDDDKDEL